MSTSSSKKHVFDQFVNLYPLSKTLRFELVPDPISLEHMKKRFGYDPEIQAFLADKEIEDAYKKLKPVLDKIHEQFITESLTSKEAKAINFSEYLAAFIELKENKKVDLKKVEAQLRKQIGSIFISTSDNWKSKTGNDSKNKPILTDNGYKILTEKNILKYIEIHAADFIETIDKETLLRTLEKFSNFFTYFAGFNQNRENFYTTKEEKDTAVATRIVSVNLPKFCDNILTFQSKSAEYLSIFDNLKSIGIALVTNQNRELEPINQDLFEIATFANCLSQQEIDVYNERINSVNQLINLYNQHKKQQQSNYKNLPFFKSLYKQIGCGKKKSAFELITDYTNKEADERRAKDKEALSVEEVLHTVASAGKTYFEAQTSDGMVHSVSDFVQYMRNLSSFDGIYWTKSALNSISGKYFNQWDTLQKTLVDSGVFTKDKKVENGFRIPSIIELSNLFRVLDSIVDWRESFFKASILKDPVKGKIIQSSTSPSHALIKCILSDLEQLVTQFTQETNTVLESTDFKSSERKDVIKNWLDQMLIVIQIIKYFSVKEKDVKGNTLDPLVAEFIKNLFEGDARWTHWYDLVRNFLTKKVQDRANDKENRLKLNFENSQLADGWDINKEPSNYCIILKSPKDKFHLAIISKSNDKLSNAKIFVKDDNNPLFKQNDEDNGWKKMEYKLLPGPNKMLPKCLLPTSDRKKYGASNEIIEIYDSGAFKKNEPNFSRAKLHLLIDFYKQGLKKYTDWQCFEFNFLPTEQYKDISQFYHDVEIGGYILNFVSIGTDHFDKLVKEGKIYLFEIKNQDSNDGKKHGHFKNLHTLYWENIFNDVENKPKLNGSAEIFYRRALQEADLEKTRDKSGKLIVKNYRFSKPKFKFHVPITLNFCRDGKRHRELIKEQLIENTMNTYIGIDRGEKNLAYYSVVDSSGKILDQGDLNIPFVDKDNKPRSIKVNDTICHDYCDLLAVREKERDIARKSWQSISQIKDLKKGYISQVVRKIADLALEYQAFIVLEDLNVGFKRGRQKIERSVYQQLELALAQKLNYLVQKNAAEGEIGSVTKGLQLTPLASNYGDIEKSGKQFGIMLYTRANYTSQTDPVTGWRKSIYLSAGSKKNIREQILTKFSDITFDGKDYVFLYTDNLGTEWKLYSGKNGESLNRYYTKKDREGRWIAEQKNIHAQLDTVFASVQDKKSIFAYIKDDTDCKLDYEELRKAIELLQQIRNFGTTKLDADFLLSPVRDEHGNHFDSRLAKDNQPKNGDANGAYNIARKGILVAEHIRRGYKLYISDQEWDAYLAGMKIWEKWLQDHQPTIIQTTK